MKRHRHNILLMKVRELLRSIINVHHDTETGGSKHHVTRCRVFQISSGIKRPEAMCKFQSQISVWLYAHVWLKFETWWGACLDLTQKGVNAEFLVTLTSVFFLEKTSFIFRNRLLFLLLDFNLGCTQAFLFGLAILAKFPLEN